MQPVLNMKLSRLYPDGPAFFVGKGGGYAN
jgi:hypothetical protein